MEFFIAGLFCTFISAICASGTNSSQWENKGTVLSTGSNTVLSSFVFRLWAQLKVDTKPYVFCIAAPLSPNSLITLDSCAHRIEKALGKPSNYFPKYSVTVEHTANLDHNFLLNVKDIYAPDIVCGKPFEKQFGIIELADDLQNPTKSRIGWVKYDSNVGTGYFTLGFKVEGESITAKQVNLLPQSLGWCQSELLYSKHERCTVIEDPVDSDYVPELGTPLFLNEMLVGINSKVIAGGNPKCGCDKNIYIYIIPGDQEYIYPKVEKFRKFFP